VCSTPRRASSDRAVTCRVAGCSAVQLLSELEAERQRDVTMGNANAVNSLQMHIYITRPERNFPTPPLRDNVGIPSALAQYASFTPQLLLEVRAAVARVGTSARCGVTAQSTFVCVCNRCRCLFRDGTAHDAPDGER
jgi:hypothetical protein